MAKPWLRYGWYGRIRHTDYSVPDDLSSTGHLVDSGPVDHLSLAILERPKVGTYDGDECAHLMRRATVTTQVR